MGNDEKAGREAPKRRPSPRASYANGVQRRQALVDAAFAVFAEEGFAGSSLRDIADRAGSSHQSVIHHFGSKEGLLDAVLVKRDELEWPLRDTLIERLGLHDGAVAIMQHNAGSRGLVQLDCTLAVEAVHPTHPAHGHVRARIDRFRRAALDDLAREEAAGRLREGLPLEDVAVQFVALVNGLQLMWLHDPGVDMARNVAAFLSLLTPDS